MLDPQVVRQLREKALRVRELILAMVGVGRAGHLGGSASIVEIVTALHFRGMRGVHPGAAAAEHADRDVFLLSKGHAALAQYAALAELGFFPVDEIDRLKTVGGMLQGHPDIMTPGVEASTGSLGQGLSIGLGFALAARIDRRPTRVYVVLGDGEMAEGQVWEAAMAAAAFRAANLVAFLDLNGVQATGPTREVFDVPCLAERWRAFGWHVQEIDGHSFPAIFAALEEAWREQDRPSMIVARTIKGKGFPFAEGKAAFHNAVLTPEQHAEAQAGLAAARRDLEGS